MLSYFKSIAYTGGKKALSAITWPFRKTSNNFFNSSFEGIGSAQASLFFLLNKTPILLKAMSREDDPYFKYTALTLCILLTVLNGYGASYCHKANNDGNSEEILAALKQEGFWSSKVSKSDFYKLPQKLGCLGEAGNHTLAGAGFMDEIFTGLKLAGWYEVSLTPEIIFLSLLAIVGLKSSFQDITNAIEGWEKSYRYRLFKKDADAEENVIDNLEAQQDVSVNNYSFNNNSLHDSLLSAKSHSAN